MQSENKDDSVQLSNRYRLYMFAKRYLRESSGRKVFPVKSGGSKAFEQSRGIPQQIA